MTGTRLDVLDAINYKTNVLDRSKVKFRSGLSIGKRNLRGLQTSIDLAIKNEAYVVLEVKQKVDLLKSVPFFKSL